MSDSSERQTLREAGLRATPARMAVLGLFSDNHVSLSHSDAVEQLHDFGMDRATVYRNLIDLADAGLLHRSDHGDHTWRFSKHAPAQEHNHPHFVCDDCGTVECLPSSSLAVKGPKIPQALRKGQGKIQIRGLCDDCEETAPSPNSEG